MTQKYQVKVSMKQAAIVETGIVLKQGDFGMQLEIEVLDFDATGTTPQIVFRKAMGAVESTTITVSGNKYTYTFKGTELDTPGKCFCDLKLKNSTTQRISTASFMFRVVADTLDGLAEESSSYSDTIEQLLQNTIQKSETEGLMKNDGTVDTNKYGLLSIVNGQGFWKGSNGFEQSQWGYTVFNGFPVVAGHKYRITVKSSENIGATNSIALGLGYNGTTSITSDQLYEGYTWNKTADTSAENARVYIASLTGTEGITITASVADMTVIENADAFVLSKIYQNDKKETVICSPKEMNTPYPLFAKAGETIAIRPIKDEVFTVGKIYVYDDNLDEITYYNLKDFNPNCILSSRMFTVNKDIAFVALSGGTWQNVIIENVSRPHPLKKYATSSGFYYEFADFTDNMVVNVLTGEKLANSNYCLIENIPVMPGQYVFFSGYLGSNNTGIAGYDKNGNFIKTVYNNKAPRFDPTFSPWPHVDEKVVIPDEVYYIAYTSRKEVNGGIRIYTDDNSDISSRIEQELKNTEQAYPTKTIYANSLNKLYPFTGKSGHTIGVRTLDMALFTVEKVILYDQTKTEITYFNLSAYGTIASRLFIPNNDFSYISFAGGTAQDLLFTDIQEKTSDDKFLFENGFYHNYADFTSGIILDVTTNIESENANYCTIKNIPVVPGQIIFFSGYFGGITSGIAGYDIDGEYKKAIYTNSNIPWVDPWGGPISHVREKVTIPDNIHFIAYTTRKDFVNGIEIYSISNSGNPDKGIITLTEHTKVPNQYKTELQNTIDDLRAITTAHNIPLPVFCIYTDLHHDNKYPNDPIEDMFKCISYLNERLHFDALINLGDAIDGQFQTKDQAEKGLAEIVKASVNSSKIFLSLEGNHDSNIQSTWPDRGGLDPSNKLSPVEMYISFQKCTKETKHSTTGRATDFYIDYPEYNLRVICLSVDYTIYKQKTATWLSTEALNTEYSVIVFSHCATQTEWGYMNDVVDGDLIDDALKTFINNGGEVICLINGHTHGDFIGEKETLPWKEIAIGCAKFSADCSGAPQGTTAPARNANDATKILFELVCINPEDRKVHFIRCGAGSNREISY